MEREELGVLIRKIFPGEHVIREGSVLGGLVGDKSSPVPHYS